MRYVNRWNDLLQKALKPKSQQLTPSRVTLTGYDKTEWVLWTQVGLVREILRLPDGNGSILQSVIR